MANKDRVINGNEEEIEVNNLFNNADLEEEVKGSTDENTSSKESSDTGDNSSTSSTNSQLSEEEIAEILKQLGIMDLSIFAIVLIIFAAVLNIRYLEWQKAKLLDTLNGTSNANLMEDLTEVPRRANLIYLFVISIFTGVIWDNHRTAASQTGEARNEQAIEDTYTNLIAILLMLLATTMNFNVLNK